ncbi:MAG: hypothetical protein ACREEP_15330 [Dongiaceae bacterium]
MAQMPIQLLPGRAESYAAASTPARVAPPRTAIPAAAYLIDTSGISGGNLRPGAMDQALFKSYLAEARKQAVTAAAAPAAAPAGPRIPTLSPAQLAALGAIEQPAEGELIIDIPGPNPADPGQAGGGAGEGKGAPAGPSAPAAPAPNGPDAAGTTPSQPAPDDGGPAATDIAPQTAPEPATPAAPAAQASAERGPIPRSRMGADGVWELPRLPDKDERDMLRGQKWRVVENEESRKLFLGPDGEFGWDDFVDLINPLQHIPLVNIAYRAITGDEIYGAARLVDFALGPLAGVSTVIDLAFKSLTGGGMAENGIAMLFGKDEGKDGTAFSTASGSQQLAGAALIRRGSIR